MRDEITLPKTSDLDAFWTHAINIARLNPGEAFSGQDDLLSLRPAAFTFGTDFTSANRLCELILNGRKKATSSYAPVYPANNIDYPSVGDLGILCDGYGIPRALLRTKKVEFFVFAEIPLETAQLEAEYFTADTPNAGYELWKTEHEALFAHDATLIGAEFNPQEQIVFEHLEVLCKND